MLLQARYDAMKQAASKIRARSRVFAFREPKMKRTTIFEAMVFVVSLGVSAFCSAQELPLIPQTRICPILNHEGDIGLSESQAKRLKLVIEGGQEKMLEARSQAEIRLQEIRRSSSDWSNLNGLAIRSLVREYYEFLAKYMIADLECMINASKILDHNQLQLLMRILSPDSLELNPGVQIHRVVAEKEVDKP